MTIRRDLKVLDKNGIVSNLYGSTIYNPVNPIDKLNDNYQLTYATISHRSQKEKIGAFAASLVEDGDTLIIDTGSTMDFLAQKLDPALDIKVLCYNNNILNHLLKKKKFSLIFSGGYYHPNTEMFESSEGISLIRSFRAKKVFVSAAGVHQTLGITCSNDYEIETKKAIISSSLEKILLVDSSKFSVIKSAFFSDIDVYDRIITDSDISEEWVEFIKSKGITLHVV